MKIPNQQANASVAGAFIAGSSAVTGSRKIPSEEVDLAFGMPSGKLRSRAGIESLAYAGENETELSLGADAARRALSLAQCDVHEIDWVVATSETHLAYPSLAAQLHAELGLRENCGALDVGGACLGLLNALAVAQMLIVCGRAQSIAVITADVHSRTLSPGRVRGEFGGLFGDGASAFVVRSLPTHTESLAYRLGEFIFGCARQYSGAITVKHNETAGLDLHFEGEALSRAAITRMEQVVSSLETLSGIVRSEVGSFATHQPNPRLVALLAKVCGVAPETFPDVARTSGNLGSSTCGAALSAALDAAAKNAPPQRKPIFLVSLGPGLLFGGASLTATLSHPELNTQEICQL